MQARLQGSRFLVIACAALVILLAASAVIQYQWSRRVAAADVQREREQLASAAALFAADFNVMVSDAAEFLEADAWQALQSRKALTRLPRLIGELYFVEAHGRGTKQVKRLAADGTFVPAPIPAWMEQQVCSLSVMEEPPALVVPIYEFAKHPARPAKGIRYMETISSGLNQCFVAQIDAGSLRTAILPQMIQKSFGETLAHEYQFAVVWRGQKSDLVYGVPQRADLIRTFFALRPRPIMVPNRTELEPGGRPPVRVEHFESTIVSGGSESSADLMDLFGTGIWELEMAHKGAPLREAFEREANWNMLLSVGVETLLLVAMAFLVVGARRMQQLADQKVRFVAGVSHELRTPVSAIAILARNQADGLVAEPEKVRQYGELIHQQSSRLNEMVEQALAYAGMHSVARQGARSEIDVRQIIESCVEARRTELAREQFEIQTAVQADMPKILGDEALLRTAIDNLLRNAQKHARAGRWIRIGAALGAGNKEVRISVEDHGPGIDEVEQAEIFEPFYRGRAAVEAQTPGSGLGLSLVRGAAEACGGRVTVAARPGGGSIFTIHIPT